MNNIIARGGLIMEEIKLKNFTLSYKHLQRIEQ